MGKQATAAPDCVREKYEDCLFNLSAAIRKFRKKAGITQNEFSKLTGISTATLIRIENRTANPRLETLLNIANVFLFDAMGGLDGLTCYNDVINKLNGFDEEQRNALLSSARLFLVDSLLEGDYGD